MSQERESLRTIPKHLSQRMGYQYKTTLMYTISGNCLFISWQASVVLFYYGLTLRKIIRHQNSHCVPENRCYRFASGYHCHFFLWKWWTRILPLVWLLFSSRRIVSSIVTNLSIKVGGLILHIFFTFLTRCSKHYEPIQWRFLESLRFL